MLLKCPFKTVLIIVLLKRLGQIINYNSKVFHLHSFNVKLSGVIFNSLPDVFAVEIDNNHGDQVNDNIKVKDLDLGELYLVNNNNSAVTFGYENEVGMCFFILFKQI